LKIPKKIETIKRHIERTDGARRISRHLDLDGNASKSFNVFISGLRKVISLEVIMGLVVALTAFVSCTEDKAEPEKIQQESMSEKSVPEVNIISIDELKEKFLGKEGVVLIDNRPAFKHQNEGHFEGSVNLTYFKKGDHTNVMTLELLEKHAKKTDIIVFYCSGAMRAHNAALAAIEWGYDPQKIFWYKGGWREWKAKGNDV
jgi:rhodanese-related sulfurtransferase